MIQIGRWIRSLDFLVLVTAILMVSTEMTVFFFHLIFVLLTWGAFSWKFRAFSWRAGFWVTVATAEVLITILEGKTQSEELIEIPMLSTILLVVFFIARRRATAQAQLEQEQAFLEAVLENTEDSVVACDAKGNLIFFNRAAQELHSLPKTSLSNAQAAEYYNLYNANDNTLIAKDDIPLFRALSGEQVKEQEFWLKPKSGSARLLLTNAKRMTSSVSGRTLGAVVVQHDITDRKRAEEKLLHDAFHDTLTNLPNRALFMDRLGNVIKRMQREDGLFAVLLSGS